MNLSDKYKKNCFKVPDGYFDNIADRVQETIREEEKKKPALMVILRPYLALAASIIFITFIFSRVSDYISSDSNELTAEVVYEMFTEDNMIMVSNDVLMNALADNSEITVDDIQAFEEVDDSETVDSEYSDLYEDIIY